MKYAALLRSVLIYLFYALALVIPISLDIPMRGDGLKLFLPTEFFTVLITGLLPIYFLISRKKQQWKWTKPDLFIIAFVSCMLISIGFSYDKTVSVKYFITVIWYISSGYFLPRLINLTRAEWTNTAIAFGTGAFLLCLWVLWRYSMEGISYESSYVVSAPFNPQGHTNLSVVIEPIFIVCIVAFTLSRSKLHSAIFLIALVAFYMVIDFSWSRATFLTSSFTIALFILGSGIRHRKRIILLLLVVILLPLGLRKSIEYVHELKYRDATSYDPKDPKSRKTSKMLDLLNPYSKEDKSSGYERKARWMAGIKMFMENPVTGIGIGTFPDLNLKRLEENDRVEGKYQKEIHHARMNIHNIYLAWWVEGGILLGLTGFILLIYMSKKGLHLAKQLLQKRKLSLIKIGILCYMAYFLLHGIFQDFTNEPRFIIIFWVVFYLLSKIGPSKVGKKVA